MNKREFLESVDRQINDIPHRVLYLDLDGTVRKGFDELGRFVNGPEDVEIFPEALARMREAKKNGWKIVAVSNQGGISLGHLSMEKCAEAMMRTQQLSGNLFDLMTWCMHHPDAKDPEFSVCWCRKPRIGMIVEAAKELCRRFGGKCPPHLALFVGDRREDKECAENAGIKFQWAADWRSGLEAIDGK